MQENKDDRPSRRNEWAVDDLIRLSSIPELNPNPIVELDLNGNLRYINPATEELLPEIEEVGIHHPFFSDWDHIVQTLKENKSGPLRREIRVGEAWFQQQFYLVPELNCVRTYAVEISEIKKTNKALQESEAKYRSLFEHTPGVVTLRQFVFDKDGEIIDQVLIDANPTCLRSWGVSSIEEVRGKKYSEFLGPKSAALALDGARKMRSLGRAITEAIHYDNMDRDYLMTFVPVGDDQIIATSMDITEQKRMENELRRSNTELQQFAYVASHDLQEPLRMVISYLTILERKYGNRLDPEAKEYIDFAVGGGKRMKALIDDLLEYSRIDTQGKDFVLVNMDSVVAKAIVVLRMCIDENQAKIEVDPLPSVIANESQMVQLIQNLLNNADKFHGIESPRITVSATPGSGEWIFSVKDNGIGLSMEYSDRIFQMFQRLHTKEKFQGTGVGLAIAKKIIERHGGRIWVESEEGKGATFYFSIPLVQNK